MSRLQLPSRPASSGLLIQPSSAPAAVPLQQQMSNGEVKRLTHQLNTAQKDAQSKSAQLYASRQDARSLAETVVHKDEIIAALLERVKVAETAANAPTVAASSTTDVQQQTEEGSADREQLIIALRKEVSDASAELDLSRLKVLARDHDLEVQVKNLMTAAAEKSRLSEELDQLKDQAKVSAAESAALRESSETMAAANHRLAQDSASSKAEVAKHEETLALTGAELETCRQQLQQRSERLRRAENKIQFQTENLRGLSQAYSVRKETVAKFEARVASLEAELGQARRDSVTLPKVQDELDKLRRDRSGLVDTLTHSLVAANLTIKNHADEREARGKLIDSIRAQLRACQRVLEEKVEETRELKRNAQRLGADVAELQNDAVDGSPAARLKCAPSQPTSTPAEKISQQPSSSPSTPRAPPATIVHAPALLSHGFGFAPRSTSPSVRSASAAVKRKASDDDHQASPSSMSKRPRVKSESQTTAGSNAGPSQPWWSWLTRIMD